MNLLFADTKSQVKFLHSTAVHVYNVFIMYV